MRSRLPTVAALLALSAASLHAQAPTIPVALSGDPAPGAPGRTFFVLNPLAVHDSGQVIFGGYLDPSDTTNDLGLWIGTPGNIQLAVRKGDVAPGTGGLFFEGFAPKGFSTGFSSYHPQMNGAGEFAFAGAIQGEDPFDGGGVWSGTPGNLSLVARHGEPAPGTVGRTFRGFGQPYLDEAGNVLFGASLDDFSQGLWHAGPGGLTAVMTRGQPAPGLPGWSFFHMSAKGFALSPSGQVLFTAEVRDAIGEKCVAMWLGGPGDPQLLAVTGDAAPGTSSTFANVTAIGVRNDGTALVHGTLGPKGQHSFDSSFWMGTPGNLTLVPGARMGDLAPGTGLPFQFMLGPSMNETGSVVFTADLDPIPFQPPTDDGIWTNARGSLELIARQDDVAPGTNGATFYKSNAAQGSHPFLPPSIDDAGTVVFQADLSGSDSGIWVWQEGQLTPVVTTVQPFEVTEGDVRSMLTLHFNHRSELGSGVNTGIYGRNAAGQIGFLAVFQDPVTLEISRGLFLTGDDGNPSGGEPPDCTTATPSLAQLWPPNHKLLPVQIQGVTDPSGEDVLLEITGVTSDEPTAGPGKHHDPDAQIVGDGTVLLRAERFGGSNGRVYEIHFTATNADGACTGSVQVSVPHDQSGAPAVDDGQVHDATLDA